MSILLAFSGTENVYIGIGIYGVIRNGNIEEIRNGIESDIRTGADIARWVSGGIYETPFPPNWSLVGLVPSFIC